MHYAQRCAAAILVLGLSFRQQFFAMAAPIATDFDDADLDRVKGRLLPSSTEHVFQPNQPLLLPGHTHEYRYRTRTLTAPDEGSSSTGIELTCMVHFEVDSGVDHDSIVAMTITKPHVFRLGTAIPDEQG